MSQLGHFIIWFIGRGRRRWWTYRWWLRWARPLLILLWVSTSRGPERWCRPIWSA